jgi:hypothetical protein
VNLSLTEPPDDQLDEHTVGEWDGQQPARVSDWSPVDGNGHRPRPAAPELAEPAFSFTDGAAFILDTPDTIPAIWGIGDEVLWAEGESLMLAGPLGLGKTSLSLLLMRARLGLLDELLGHPVTATTGTILYLAMDRPAQVARAARRIFTEAERDVLASRVRIWQGPPPADIARNPELLARLADAADADTVFLDSVKDAALGLSDDEVGAGYNRARQYLLREGRQLAEDHHTVKRGQNGGPPDTVTDIYGSAWITNGTGSIVMLTGQPGDPIVRMRHVRYPSSEVGPYRLIHEQTTGRIEIHHKADLIRLVRAKMADGLTAKDAAAVIFELDTPSDAQIEKARRKLSALERDGLLVAVKGVAGGSNPTPTAWFLAERTRAEGAD